MNNRTKNFAVVSIITLLFTCVFVQTSFLASSVPKSQSNDNLPKSSDYDETYDLGGTNTMNINTDDAGNNSVTTLNNGTTTYSIDSTFTEGSSGSSETVINDTYKIYTDNSNKTILMDKNNDFNVTIDNGFNPHSVDSIQAKNYYDDLNSDISSSAEISDYDENRLGYFELWDNGEMPWYVFYEWDAYLNWELLNINDTVYVIQSFDWILLHITADSGLPMAYNVSLFSGEILWSDDFGTNWYPTGHFLSEKEIFYDGLFGISLVYVNDTIIVTDNYYWEIVVNTFYWQASVYHLISSFYLIWIFSVTITLYWGYWTYIFYLWIVYELLFVFIYIDYDWKIEYYYTYIVIVWVYIQITIWYFYWYIHWVIIFWWEWWIIKIQWWYYFTFYWYFIDYIIWIEYRYLIYNWIYIYYVPTLILPNLLYIDHIKEEYTQDTFYFTVAVKDCLGNPIIGALVTGTWGGIPIIGVIDNLDGTYSFTVSSVFVSTSDPGIILSLTASKLGYADGHLDTEIAVEAPPEPPKILQIDYIDTVYTDTTFSFTIKVKDNEENLISGATITGTWNETSIATVTDKGGGIYSFSVSAILVEPGDPGIWLNLTASKTGYTNGELNTEIAVDPDTVTKEATPPDDDGDGDGRDEIIPGPTMFLIGVISSFSSIFVATYLIKRKKLVKN